MLLEKSLSPTMCTQEDMVDVILAWTVAYKFGYKALQMLLLLVGEENWIEGKSTYNGISKNALNIDTRQRGWN